MHKFKNIVLIGTSHIAEDSITTVKNQIREETPEIVALELDYARAYSLKHKTKRPKNLDLLRLLGVKGFLFYIVGEYLQKKLGKIVNIQPGAEMLTALNEAEKQECMIFLIDRDINITLRRISTHFRKREIIKILVDVIKGFFKKDEMMKIDLSKLPPEELIDKVLKETKKRYPSLYKVLIDERDRFMANRLYHISKDFPDKKILAVVGAGHIKGILRYLKHLEKETFK